MRLSFLIESKLPQQTFPAGTILYHGTDCTGDFQIPDGPAWFAWSEREARGWIGWSESVPQGRIKGEGRVLAIRLVRPVTLVDVRSLEDWKRAGEAFDLDEPGPGYLAQHFAEAGWDGWWSDSEVMLTHPDEVAQPE